MKKIFILLLLIGLAFAADSSYIIEGIGLIISAIALVMAVIAVAFMLSKLFAQPRLEVWAKSETFNLLISVLIVGLIPTLLLITVPAIESAIGGDQFEISYNYLNSLSSGKGIETAKSLLIGSYGYQFKATAYWFIGGIGPWGGAGKEYKADYISRSVHQEMLLNFAMLGVVSIEIQKLFLQFIQYATLSVLLPIAIVLRIIPFSREAGNFLIALSIGFVLIFPLTYVLYAQTFSTIDECPYITDHVVGGDFNAVGRILPQAIFLPNLSIVILTMSVMALMAALRGLPTR